MLNKRGQVAIWVIVALVIVIGGLLFVFFRGNLDLVSTLTGEFSPNTFLENCLEPEVRKNVEVLSKQGGSFNVEGGILYDGRDIKYLCYTNQNYELCKVQQPLLKKHFEDELDRVVNPIAVGCFSELKSEYERRGYSVEGGSVEPETVITSGSIRVGFASPLTVSKEEERRAFGSFEVIIDSEMYDLLSIATSIIDFESSLGDSETGLYIQYYPDLTIDKRKLSDGTTIYNVGNVVTGEEFSFASRSLAWPPGYGLEE
jgi:hypothetical protein